MIAISAVVGLLIGLAAHDLAVHSLGADTPLRVFTATCPRCGERRGWLSPRCPGCGRVVGREVAVMAATAAVSAGFALAIGVRWALIAYLAFALLTAALLVTDLDALRIVDRINLPGTALITVALAVAALADGDIPDLIRGLGGALAYFSGALLLFVLVRGRGFGAGDVKLAPQLGLFTAYVSWGTLAWAVFATAMLGGLVAAVLLVGGRAGLKTELPYGPSMIVGAWLAIALAGLGVVPVPG